MLIEVNDTIAKGLIASGIAKEAFVPAVTAEPVLSWPRVIEVATPWGIAVRINAAAPLNARWYPGMAASIVGQGGVLADPSNGAAIGQPIRSAAGFPLQYALATGGGYVGTPSVMVGDRAFNSDAEVLDYLARAASPGFGGVRSGTGAGHPDAKPIDTALLAEWDGLPSDDRVRGVWLNNHPGFDQALRRNNLLPDAESNRYAIAAGGFRE